MLVYVWSRNFPTGNVSLMGLVQVQVRLLGMLQHAHYVMQSSKPVLHA